MESRTWTLKGAWLFLLLNAICQADAQGDQPAMDTLAKRLETAASRAPASSVYIRTSKGVYETMEDCWFMAYVLNAQSFLPFDGDKTLYVRLIQEDRDSVVWKEKYYIDRGMAEGHIYIDHALPEGDYLLEAYTAHSFYGNDSAFYAFRRIRIIKDIHSLEKRGRPERREEPVKRVQCNFFPEGGQLVEGLNSRVAFKAVDDQGMPLPVTGTLLQDGSAVQEFSSLHDGMGSFSLTPQPGRHYTVRLRKPAIDTVYSLPQARPGGLVMQLAENNRDDLVFRIAQGQAEADRRIYLRLQVRGMVQLMASGLLRDSLRIRLPLKEVPAGMAEVTLFNERLQPLAERLLYIQQDKRLHITTTLLKTEYKNREKVEVTIKATDREGKPVVASLGVTVYDRLYDHEKDPADIVTHYHLNTQLRGRIFNPGYYFDQANKDRKEALDLLLLTQGWRSYTWNEANVKEPGTDSVHLLPDGVAGQLEAVRKKRKPVWPQALIIFAQRESNSRMIFPDSLGRFALSTGDLMMGRRIYIKYFGEDEYKILVPDPFQVIAEKKLIHLSPLAYTGQEEEKGPDTALSSRILQGAKMLKEVVVTARGNAPAFRDKYLGYLDSLAKMDGNTDYVCALNPNGYLNCPACKTSPNKPVEGKEYPLYIGKREIPSHHYFYFRAEEVTHVIYHYPKFTEAELLKKFRLSPVQGYYGHRDFYEPNYDKEDPSEHDYRNTLAWLPNVVTDKNGEAVISFFCSDIDSRFRGIVEGLGTEGLLGKQVFDFVVK